MKTTAAFVAGLILATAGIAGASGGVPDLAASIDALFASDAAQQQQIDQLEKRVARLERKRHPHVVCRVTAGQPLPSICGAWEGWGGR